MMSSRGQQFFQCGFEMLGSYTEWLVLLLVVGLASSTPISYRDPESRPLAGLSQRLASHSSLLEPRSQEPRLPIPTLQDLEAIKKVAQILVMLGEQHRKRNPGQLEILNRIVDTLRTLRIKTRRSQTRKHVIPTILGDSGAPHTTSGPSAEEIPNDPVEV